VIGTLREGGFGYLKIDYNETLGIGADGAESPGEALRDIAAASLEFIRQIRRELPDLIIENCSSGGHRLVAPLLATTAMSSFSDAHECREIPIIAANLHRLLHPRQSQIWAIFRDGEPDSRTVYSLAAGFLGRLCLSGEVPAEGTRAHRRLHEALSLYRGAAPIIREGISRRFGSPVLSYRHPQGWQALRRMTPDGKRILVVLHTFARPGAEEVRIPLPTGRWRIEGLFPAAPARPPTAKAGTLRLSTGGPFRAQVVLLSSV